MVSSYSQKYLLTSFSKTLSLSISAKSTFIHYSLIESSSVF